MTSKKPSPQTSIASEESEEETANDFLGLLQNQIWIASPEFAGWLTKKSSNWFINKSALFSSRSWAKKWVSLHGTELVYMKEEPNIKNLSHLKIRREEITPATVITSHDDKFNGFTISFGEGEHLNWHFRADTAEEKANWLIKCSQVQAIVLWLDQYERVRMLGVGGQGMVYELRNKATKKSFALKEIEIKNDKQMQASIKEAQFLQKIVKTIKHPNLMQIEKVFQIGYKFYMVFPLCTGGELYDSIVQRGHFTEHDAAIIMYDLISALATLHKNNILHLDIKPENILFENKGKDSKIILSDFGLSKVLSEAAETWVQFESTNHTTFQETFNKKLQHFIDYGEIDITDMSGTYGYMSPEIILTKCYSKAADVFAAGVVLYILLCGKPPFYSKSTRQTFLKTLKGEYDMSSEAWDWVSEEAKDLVKKMLIVNPEERISTEDILNHPWIVYHIVDWEDPSDNLDILENTLPPVPEEHSITEPIDETHNIENFVDLPQIPQSLKSSPSKQLTSSQSLRRPVKNLTNALSHLADHIKHLKSDKMAATVSRFMSSTGTSKSRLSQTYLIPIHENTKPTLPLNNSESQLDITQQLAMVSQDMKLALATAIFHCFGQGNKMTVDQYLQVRNFFDQSFGSNDSNADVASSHEVPNNQAGISLKESSQHPIQSISDILLIYLIDEDHDGFITIDELLRAEVKIFQMQDEYLQIIFRTYAEGIWYPGQHLNARKALKLKSQLATNKEDFTPVVEPPKYITEKNIYAVFEKFGYDPELGVKAFNILYELLRRTNNHHLGTLPNETGTEDPLPAEGIDTSGASSGRSNPTHSVNIESDIHSLSLQDQPKEVPEESKPINPLTISGKDEDSSSKRLSTLKLFASNGDTSQPTRKIDFADFRRMVSMDDIFVQVFHRHTRERMLNLIQRVQEKLSSKRNSFGISSFKSDNHESVSLLSNVFEEEIRQLLHQMKSKANPIQKS